jgi:hypothetical protein
MFSANPPPPQPSAVGRGQGEVYPPNYQYLTFLRVHQLPGGGDVWMRVLLCMFESWGLIWVMYYGLLDYINQTVPWKLQRQFR